MNVELAKFLGSNIKEVRKAKTISQEQLALLTSIDRSYIGRIERGEVSITVEKLYDIAKTLEVKPQSLLP
ncbi:helix-turn-helix transcriptional regulator [Acinetobacter sp. F-1]|jgi:transcriptional regulator with XRE-family HTH domain|uniref:helix-turn-helix domain-containing protein n=1 Tax=Acinetobacter TaxID=469 RepID=UPI001FD20A48|nr:helix-turn-helix transcriptional regulator [Acinetobacter sp. F-1]